MQVSLKIMLPLGSSVKRDTLAKGGVRREELEGRRQKTGVRRQEMADFCLLSSLSALLSRPKLVPAPVDFQAESFNGLNASGTSLVPSKVQSDGNPDRE